MMDDDDSDLDVLELRGRGSHHSAEWKEAFTTYAGRAAKQWQQLGQLEAATNPRRYRTALHEAGHTVHAYSTPNFEIRYASIISYGRTGGRILGTRSINEPGEQSMVRTLCGPMAESVWGNCGFRLSGSDEEKVRYAVWELDPDSTMDAFRRSPLFQKVWQLAHHFVVEHEEPVKVLAVALCKFSILNFSEIDQLFSMET
jgi:hypothetical protein